MKLFQSIEGIMVRLGELPGLGFLASFVSDVQERRNRRQQTLFKYQSYVRSLRGAAGEAGRLAPGRDDGPKKRAHANEDKIEDEGDDSEVAYNEEDDDFESYML
jgi:hypothetical protein